jgi:hypothetical protein
MVYGRTQREYRALAERSRQRAEAAKDDAVPRRNYLDLAASYDRFADLMRRWVMDCERDRRAATRLILQGSSLIASPPAATPRENISLMPVADNPQDLWHVL